jgi:hypothetical protein
MDTSRVDKKRSLSRQDSQGDRSPKRSRSDSPSGSSRARDKHVFMWSRREHPNEHSEEQSRIDPMILEAQIAGWHNNQTDQQASKSSGGSERGDASEHRPPKHLKSDAPSSPSSEGKDDLSSDMKKLPDELKLQIFQKLDVEDDNLIAFYRSSNKKQRVLSMFDREQRQKFIENLDDYDLEDHFNTLKTSAGRKQFLGWLNRDRIVELYFEVGDNPQAQERKDFVTALEFEQIAALHADIENEDDQANLRCVIPFEHLKKLNDLKNANGYQSAYLQLEIRQNAEKFNELGDNRRERQRFVSKLSDKQLVDLYEYFYEWDNNTNNRKELFAVADSRKRLLRDTFEDPNSNFEGLIGKELSVIKDALRFEAKKYHDERRKFIQRLLRKDSGIDKVVDLYRLYSDKPEMQAQLCEASTWEDIENFTKKLTPGESEVALSYLERWRGKSRKEDTERVTLEHIFHLVDKRVKERLKEPGY